MAEILFVTWDGGGNVPPALALAEELSKRAHRVRFLGHAVQAEKIEARGFGFIRSPRAQPFSSMAKNSPFTMLAMFADSGMGADVVATARAERFDLVVIDCLLVGVLAAVKKAGLRYVVLEHLYDGYYTRGFLSGPAGIWSWLRRQGSRAALDGAVVRLVATSASLDPIEKPSANVRQIGPVIPELAAGGPLSLRPGAQEPCVLVSLSTFAFPRMLESLQKVVDATADLGVRVIVTTGPAIDPKAVRPHAHAEVHRYVPHAELMKVATLFIGHGGHGTAMLALAHDLPVLLMPMDGLSDQPWVARSIQEQGAGRAVKRGAAVAELRAHITELMADGPHRQAAARLGAELRAAAATRAGAAVLDELVNDPVKHASSAE
jgi:UDP:flavonoid glycosyltransferase YjiC (YdhE family)